MSWVGSYYNTTLPWATLHLCPLGFYILSLLYIRLLHHVQIWTLYILIFYLLIHYITHCFFYLHFNLYPIKRMVKSVSSRVSVSQTYLYQDFSYGEILAGRPGAWLVKNIFSICMQSQNFKQDLILKFNIISRTCFVFMIILL